MSLVKNHFDVIIIGGALPGLILARRLRQMNKKVALLDVRDHLGDIYRTTFINEVPLPSNLNFFADSESNQTSLKLINSVLLQNVESRKTTAAPVSFENSHKIPFVGFGDQKYSFIDELSFYSADERLELNHSPEEWVDELIEQDLGEIHYLSEVTSFVCSEGRVTEIVVNGSKSLTADHYFSTLAPPRLTKLFSVDALPAKPLQKIAKTKYATSVELHFLHKGDFRIDGPEQESLIFLMGLHKEGFEPSFGRFFWDGLPEPGQYASIWTCLLSPEDAEEAENMGRLIKNIKKLLKRAYPEASDQIVGEKIYVRENSHGHINIKTEHPAAWQALENFYSIHPMYSSANGVLGCAASAVELANSL